jgi:phenylpropionate dioxygenase-like ring-hydroxylating dioxygenase large terminal subunit
MTQLEVRALGRDELSTLDLAALVQPERVHRRLYVDPAIFAEEMRRVFGGTWVYLCHESQVPNPNDFFSTTMGLRPVIVTRTKDGSVAAMLNRCTHRAATVCREAAGTARVFTCPYHGWSYANDGRLIGMPWPEGYGPEFDKEAHGLGRVRVETYRGFVFGTLNPFQSALRDWLGAAAEYLDHWLDRSAGGEVVVRSGAIRQVYAGNWKLTYDNAADGYHPSFSHRSLLGMVAARYGEGRDMQYFGRNPDQGDMYVEDLGNGHTFLDQRPEMSGYWDWVRPMPGMEAGETLLRQDLGDEEARRQLESAPGSGMNLNIFPNLLIIGNQIQRIEPLGVDSTRLVWWSTTTTGDHPYLSALRMRMQEDFPAFGEPDDLTNFEECQRGLSIEEVEWLDVSRGLSTGRQTTDRRGVCRGPVTDELTIRGYYQEWLRLMTTEFTLHAPPAAGGRIS